MSRVAENIGFEDYPVQELSEAQTQEIFDKAVFSTFGISVKEFIDNYRNGVYEDHDDCDLMSILMLLPFTCYSAEYGKQQKHWAQ